MLQSMKQGTVQQAATVAGGVSINNHLHILFISCFFLPWMLNSLNEFQKAPFS